MSPNKIQPIKSIVALVSLLSLSLCLQSCTDECTETNNYTYYEPVFTPLSVIRSSVAVIEPKPLTTVGKIYIKDNFLFVNDPGEGVHVIDNSDPASPVKKKFITIPGNYDISIRGNILYADSYIDLVALDISDINEVKEVSRLENIFQSYNSLGWYANEQQGLVTDWVETKSVTSYECNEFRAEYWGGMYYDAGILVNSLSGFNSKAAISPISTGVGGSMARFTINSEYLYMLDGGNLHTADISIPESPSKVSSQYISWDIETIFPTEDKLFLGARGGMHIYDLATSPENPTKITTYAHINSCDPVVVSDEYAYVTLRSGNECAGFTNQLEVISLATIETPSLIKVYPMHNPHGLGIDGNTLFICDGSEGLKIYDATNKSDIANNMLKHYKNIDAFDVIPFHNVLIMIGNDGIHQYDYSDPLNITKLSHLKLSGN